ncbi:MAG: PP2C family protein-serine/threonine phosphatase [Gammaproteobacteria bacterium]
MPWIFGQALGIGRRSEQQDRLGLFHSDNGKRHLLVVADGMGGLPQGDRAAQIVVDTAEQAFHRNKIGNPEQFLETICARAHERINRLEENPASAPGSTCVILFIDRKRAYWAHIGDSRLYRFRGDCLIDQTLDHSVMQLMIDEGVFEASSDEVKAFQNQLYKRLGGPTEHVPDIHTDTLEDGDLFLLCSDGFWQSVDTGAVPELLREYPLDRDGADRLAELALINGGQYCDNISVSLALWERDRTGFFGKWFGGR